jgi:hypothetical protein
MFNKNQKHFSLPRMTAKKPKFSHGGRRPGAGRKCLNGARVLLTVRIAPEVRAVLMARIGRERGALTRYVEELIKADLGL